VKPAGFVETWRDFGRGTKALFLTMLLFGVAVFGFGVYADFCHTEWLKSYSYLPNILAGFTGFLIGVPVALVGLSTITTQREEKAASDRVQGLTQIAWIQYRKAVLDLCGEDRISALEDGAKRIQKNHDETISPIRHYYDVERTEEKAKKVLAFANQQIPVWGKAFDDLETAFGSSYGLALRWFAILRDWNTLDQFVRLQRLERGLPWFERELDSYLLTRMSEDEFPMADFFRVSPRPIARI
jgi:hypothetical protein